MEVMKILLVNQKWKGGQNKILLNSKWYMFISVHLTEVWFTVRKKVTAT